MQDALPTDGQQVSKPRRFNDRRISRLPPHGTEWRRPRRRSKAIPKAMRTSPPQVQSQRAQCGDAPINASPAGEARIPPPVRGIQYQETERQTPPPRGSRKEWRPKSTPSDLQGRSPTCAPTERKPILPQEPQKNAKIGSTTTPPAWHHSRFPFCAFFRFLRLFPFTPSRLRFRCLPAKDQKGKAAKPQSRKGEMDCRMERK